MVWAKDKIKKQLENKKIYVGSDDTHMLENDDIVFDDASMEVHLSSVFKIWNTQITKPVDPTIAGSYEEHFDKNTLTVNLILADEYGKYFLLKPGQLVLCEIYEYIDLKNAAFASIESKSKMARLGISVHNAAPSIHPNYKGRLTLEIVNHSLNDIILRPYDAVKKFGTLIAQIFFEDVQHETDILGYVNSFCRFIEHGIRIDSVIDIINSMPLSFASNDEKTEIINELKRRQEADTPQLQKTGTDN